jgi:hypothetical protein
VKWLETLVLHHLLDDSQAIGPFGVTVAGIMRESRRMTKIKRGQGELAVRELALRRRNGERRGL